jgi:hypothetical protein
MKKEIREELEKMAPTLLEIGNQNPYRVPPMYFENMEIVLNNVPDVSQQGIPNNYFENLANKVVIKAKTKKPVRIISLHAKRWMAAASIVIICVASYFTMNTNDTMSDNQSFVLDVEIEEAFDYLADQDELYFSEVLELSDGDFFEETEGELYGDDIDFLLDEVTLDDLDELL